MIGDELPSWATFDKDKRVINVVAPVDPKLPGTSVPITIEASYSSLAVEMSFAVSFIGEKEEPAAIPRPTVVDTEPEPTPEGEPIEEVVEEVQATGWDGWKSLLLSQIPGFSNFELPPPNPDPLYVPTPPVPKLELMGKLGDTRITFSEDVFEYPNLKTLKVPRSPRGGGPARNLQAEE